MKHFYKIFLIKESQHLMEIVKAETEEEARAMMPEGAEIVSVQDKGPVE